jgi:hypothetical protein
MKRDLPISDPVLAQALAAETALDQAHEARRQGELALALAHAQSAHALAPLAGLRAAAGLLACFCQFRLGLHRPLLALGENLLDLVTDPASRLELLRWLVVAAAETEHFALAQRLGSEALALAERQADANAQTAVRQAVALGLERMGDPWRAEQLLGEGLAQAESQPNALPLLGVLQQLALNALDQHHLLPDRSNDASSDSLQRAAAYAKRAQAVAKRVGDSHFHGFLDGLLGEARLHLGACEEAWPLLERALCQAQAHGQHGLASRLECAVAEGLLQRDQAPAALARLQSLLADNAEQLPRTLQQRAHRAMAQACRALNQLDRAAMHQAQAERLQSAQAPWALGEHTAPASANLA